MKINPQQYGVGNASYKAAGGIQGIRRLVDQFFDYMDRLPEARRIRDMHPDNLDESRDRLVRFLCGWLGGPKLYQQEYGSISIPGVHQHLDIGAPEKDAWLKCMSLALQEQSFSDDFRDYLMAQLSIPAERIRMVCQACLEENAGDGL